jgi:hypothetical protein
VWKLKLSQSWEKVMRLRLELKEANFNYWIHENLFSWTWWTMLAIVFLVIILWWKIVDKNRIMEILLFGTFTSLIAIFLDVAGVSFVLWGYPTMIFPLVPPLVFVDIVLLPILYMVVYQYFLNWKSYIIGSILASAFAAFILEPISEYFKIYQLSNWKFVYSFPIYIFIALFIKWILNKVKAISYF